MSKVFEALEKARRERRLVDDKDFLARPRTAAASGPKPRTRLDRVVSPPAESRPSFEYPAEAIEERLGFPDEHMVSLLAPTSFEAEQYRRLRHVVERGHKEEGLSVVAVTSPSPGDGKTTTAINLAGSLAQAQGARVLLVDADLRHPTIAEKLGMSRSHDGGLVACIEASISLLDSFRFLPDFNLAILPSGRPPERPYELLESTRLGELLHEARQLYDYIVLDTPPVVPYPDCTVLESHVDGFLVVVSAHRTQQTPLEDTFQEIDSDKILGLVFNRLSDYPSNRYYTDRSRFSGGNGRGSLRPRAGRPPG